MADGKIIATHEAKNKTVKIEFEENGIAWVFLNRPEKRNAMSPAPNQDMVEGLEMLEFDDRAKVLVLTGAGEAWTAGMDLREFFRALDKETPAEQARQRRSSEVWQFRMLRNYPKPTIAMVNGWCFGGAFTPLVSCDLAIAAEEAQFGLSEINWGIIPAGNVMRAVADRMSAADAQYYLMTGDTFDGRKAAAMKLINEAVPRAQLKAHTTELAKKLMQKNPHVLSTVKLAWRRVKDMSWDVSEDYLYAKAQQCYSTDPEQGRSHGMGQFLDDKSY